MRFQSAHPFGSIPISGWRNFREAGRGRFPYIKPAMHTPAGARLYPGKSNRGHFLDFAVREDLRGKGSGSRIHEFAIQYFKEKGIKTLRLHVFKNNSSVI